MNVDVLIWGGTHKVEAYTLEGKFFVNPGSATGAFSTDWPEGDEEEETKEEVKEDGEEKKEEVKNEENDDDKKSEEETKEKESEKVKTEEEEDKTNEDQDEDDADEIYDSVPSFTLLDIQGSVITLYIYTYIGGEIKVDKVSYRKDQQ